MSGYLELPDGGFLGVKDGLVFGRTSGCDVVVDDTKASRRHARLVVESGVVEIEDLDSSNGTLLNGKPIQRRMLRDGDEVRIGKTVIKYRDGALPGSQAKSQSSAGSASIFEDDDDLFGDNSPAVEKPAAAAPPPAPAPESDDLLDGGDDLFADEPAPEPVAEPARRPSTSSSPPAGNVVEFEDEVVEVEQSPAPKPAPTPPAKPVPTRRVEEPVVEVRTPRTEAPSGKASNSSERGGEVAGASGRILQYSKKSGGKNPLGDDLGQMSGTMRLVVVLGVVAVGAGIVYGIMTAMS